MQRAFSSLSPSEALQVAISIEQRNAEVYHHFAEVFTEFGDEESLEIASVFWEMAVEERSHRSLLEQKYQQAYGALSSTLTEAELQELIEVPRLNGADVFSSVDGLAARERALHVALEAEISAQQFYQKLVPETPAGPLRKLYEDLAEMEDGHVVYLESKLVNGTASSPTVQ